MIVRNSRSRDLIKSRLSEESEKICSMTDSGGIGRGLRKFSENLRAAFVLDWIPEQAEDIYWVLFDGDKIIKIEISRLKSLDVVVSRAELIGIEEFRKSRNTRRVRERLDAALELIEESGLL